jgi:hypothetical protein
MKVSVIWLGVSLILAVLLGLLWKGKGVYEAFQEKQQEGFQNTSPASLDDLNLNTCPANTNQFVDHNGLTLCCDGEIADGKCSKPPICSLSEGTATLPTCSTWYAAYLNEKGRNRCPTSMPNYYESKDGTVKGCTNGRRSKTGSAPLTQTQQFCRLYTTREQEEREPDSCTNQRILESTKCFSRDLPNVSKRIYKAEWHPTAPAYVMCTYAEPKTLNVTECLSDQTYNRLIDRLIEKGDLSRNWKTNEMNEWNKIWYCSLAEKVKIDKTLDFADLKKTPAPP